MCVASFVVIFLSVTVYDINKILNELSKNLENVSQRLGEFIISQVLIENSDASVELAIQDSEEDRPYKIQWIQEEMNIGIPGTHWIFPFSWEYQSQIKSFDGRSFGYLKIDGSLFKDTSFSTELVVRAIFLLLATLVVIGFLLPLAIKIPRSLFIEPILDLLNLLKAKTGNPSQKTSDDMSIEIYEVMTSVEALISQTKKDAESRVIAEVAAKVAHDLKSPLSSLKIILEEREESEEDRQKVMTEVISRIQEISEDLLSQYNTGQKPTYRPMTVLSTHIRSILREKQILLKGNGKKLEYHENVNSSKALVRINESDFKRALSNILNNAIEAMENKNEGKIRISLDCDEKFLFLSVTDEGSGIPPDSLEIIRSDQPFTKGKQAGHGLGLMQVKEMVKQSNGLFLIDSTVHTGTTITLKLPKCKIPFWFPERIVFLKNSLIIILDDDPSVHETWKMRLRKFEGIHLRHFTQGLEAISFIRTLDPSAPFLLLSDYDLSNEITGTDVIKQSRLKNSILVTSHYSNPDIIREALLFDFKILPKSLLHMVEIIEIDSYSNDPALIIDQCPDLLMVDDNRSFAETIIRFKLKSKRVVFYQDPLKFLREFKFYPKETPVCIDYNLEVPDLQGLLLLEKLYFSGFKNLWLSSGEKFRPEDLPDFVRFIEKHRIHEIFQT